MEAPICVAKGTDVVARKIREMAERMRCRRGKSAARPRVSRHMEIDQKFPRSTRRSPKSSATSCGCAARRPSAGRCDRARESRKFACARAAQGARKSKLLRSFPPRRESSRTMRRATADECRLRVCMGAKIAAFPGRNAARSEAKCCVADPGSLRALSLGRSRISGAALHAAPRPGNRLGLCRTTGQGKDA